MLSGKVEGVRISDPQPHSYTPIWSQEELEGVKITHDPPKDKTETVSEKERERRGGREGELERERGERERGGGEGKEGGRERKIRRMEGGGEFFLHALIS